MCKYRIKNVVNNMTSKMLVEVDAFLEISGRHQQWYCLLHSVVMCSSFGAHTKKAQSPLFWHLFSSSSPWMAVHRESIS